MIHRIDVRTAASAHEGKAGTDPVGEAIRHQIREFAEHIGPISTARIFLLDTDAPAEQIQRVARELLADPIVEAAQIINPDAAFDPAISRVEIHLKPGVMDPVAASTEMAMRDMGLDVREVRTGRAYLISGAVERVQLEEIARRVLANEVIESVHFEPYVPREFQRAHEYQFKLNHVPLLQLGDEQLTKLSRDGHLFLSLTEMKAVQSYFREQGREPTDIELETIAQTWSEHCVHKTLKSAVEVFDESGTLLRSYGNLIRDTIFDSTMQLMGRSKSAASPERTADSVTAMGGASGSKDDFCLSVFKDNAGVVAFDETDAVCFKVETHNHPSAIEPYGGAATGIGGCIRDILGTGLGAKPIANTNVFCVAYPDAKNRDGDGFFSQKTSQNEQKNRDGDGFSSLRGLPKGVIHPKRILQQVVAGVRDYGNRMGIPTVNGGVYFDDNYIGNPLVFAGCVGLIPRDRIHKQSRAGDAIVLMGGRTGRDGIHGATFSSAELTDTHADEFSHAVQIGNAITQKKMADVILQARDRGLFSAITDCGAGGLSSAVGEMGEKVGARVELDRVPLKYAGLRYDEIWISEAQERMVLSVPAENVEQLLKMARDEDVEATVIGTFGTDDRQLVLNYRAEEVGRLSMHFLHDGIPMPKRKAVIRDTGVPPVRKAPITQHGRDARVTVREKLLAALAHPNIASKHWIIRQYDHEVQGGSVIKPLIGPQQIGPSDAAVVRPKLSSFRGVAIGNGMAPNVADPYEMALAAIDEAVRNVVAVGADPDRVAILDNFCWPSVDDERTMGTLVRACEACRDAALAYGIPFISGKDSLHNQFTNSETGQVIRIPSTLLISAIGVIEDVRKCITMDFKAAGNHLYLVQPRAGAHGPTERATVHRAMSKAIRAGHVISAHDVSDGGIATAAAEMAIAADLGISIDAPELLPELFNERPGRYLVELAGPARPDALAGKLFDVVDVRYFGTIGGETFKLRGNGEDAIPIEDLRAAWRGTLDW